MRSLHHLAWIVLALFGPTGAIAVAQQEAGPEPPGQEQQSEEQQQEQQEQQQQEQQPAAEQEQQEQQPAAEQQQQEQQEQQPAAEQQQAEGQPEQQGQQVQAVRGMRVAIRLEALNEDVIQRLQQKLKQAGHFEGETEGTLDQKTEQALTSYQQKRGMEPTGQLDLETERRLNLGIVEQVRPVRGVAGEQTQQGDPMVRQAQERLAADGLYEAQVDGLMGPDTASAIRAFQQREGIEVTGRLDDRTKSAMGIEAQPQQPQQAEEQRDPEQQQQQEQQREQRDPEQQEQQQEQQREQQPQHEQQQGEQQREQERKQ